MSEPKWTKGPWEVMDRGDAHWLIVGTDGFTMATAPFLPNARLTAAAPELYEALVGILSVITTDDLVPESVSYMREARAALSKARGE